MWTKLKTAIFTAFINIKAHILDMFSLKKTVEKNTVIKSYETKFLTINETTYTYRILYLESRKIIDIEELTREIEKLKDLIDFQNNYLRINAELLCHFESIDRLGQIQTKTYGMFSDDYKTNMISLLKDLKLLSEKDGITYISEI